MSASFASFFMAGFECSTQRRRDGVRLDLLRSTGHAMRARADYEDVARLGLRTVRDGFRWHLVERAPGIFDWSSAIDQIRAAREVGVQVIWDLFHYGWPEDIDIWSDAFPERFATFAAAAARLLATETDEPPLFCPVNEISYVAWAGGEVGLFHPLGKGRGGALKRQLVRSAVAAAEAIRAVDGRARFFVSEPLINVVPRSDKHKDIAAAEAYRVSQFEALDMLTGRRDPELGGHPDLIDVVGVNFYPHNQWYLGGETVPLGHHAYKPLRVMLQEVAARYPGRPIIMTETGAEGTAKPTWLYYVGAEARAALGLGVPLAGICLYPVVDYPGWDNDRTCSTGLLSMIGSNGHRAVDLDFATELAIQQRAMQRALEEA